MGFKPPSMSVTLSDDRSFDFYPGTIVLTNQYYSLFGHDVFRLCGIFGEPGHFGLILIMFFYINHKIINTFKGKIILLAGILTMSFAFYVLLSGLIVYTMLTQKKIIKLLAVAIAICVIIFLLYYILPPDVLERFFLNKANGALDERTSVYFQMFYDNFLETDNTMFGLGNDVLTYYDLTSSDYRAFLVRYGFLGLFIYVIWFCLINLKTPISKTFLSLFYFIIVFAHRSWFVDYLVFLFFIYVLAIGTLNTKKNSYE